MSKTEKVSQYNDLPYGREVVDKLSILQKVRDELGLTQGQLSQLVVDGKIQLCLNLNDYSFSSYKYLNSINMPTNEDYVFTVDDKGVFYCMNYVLGPLLYIYDMKKKEFKYSDLVGANYGIDYQQRNASNGGKYNVFTWEATNIMVFCDGVKIFDRLVSDDMGVGGSVGNVCSISPNGKYIGCMYYLPASAWLVVYEGVV